MIVLTWIAIFFCLSQSAMLSGMNLAFFTVSRLELKIQVAKNNRYGQRVMSLREDANFLLVTILWGNVAVNVLLALLTGSVLTGVAAFLFSTLIITIFGEIIPQAYFSRNALKFGALFSPVIRFYQVLLYPVAKPTAMFLDRFVGPEAISYYKEKDIRELIKLHMASTDSDIEKVEGQGAINFLELDDVPLSAEGEVLDPTSIVSLPFRDDCPVFPQTNPDLSDAFLKHIHRSGKKWVVLVDERNLPRRVIDSDEFIRDALFEAKPFNPHRHCHRPIVSTRGDKTIGQLLSLFKVKPTHCQDDVVDNDIILLWGEEKRVIAGADVLGRLLRGIVQNPAKNFAC